MSVGVSLPGIGQSIASCGVSLTTSSLDLPFAGESLFGMGVSIITISTSVFAGTLFSFNSTTQSMYHPLIAGFP